MFLKKLVRKNVDVIDGRFSSVRSNSQKSLVRFMYCRFGLNGRKKINCRDPKLIQICHVIEKIA